MGLPQQVLGGVVSWVTPIRPGSAVEYLLELTSSLSFYSGCYVLLLALLRPRASDLFVFCCPSHKQQVGLSAALYGRDRGDWEV